MNIEIKKSKKPIKYEYALNFMEQRLLDISKNNIQELIWTLEHNEVYTAGTSYLENEILVQTSWIENVIEEIINY